MDSKKFGTYLSMCYSLIYLCHEHINLKKGSEQRLMVFWCDRARRTAKEWLRNDVRRDEKSSQSSFQTVSSSYKPCFHEKTGWLGMIFLKIQFKEKPSIQSTSSLKSQRIKRKSQVNSPLLFPKKPQNWQRKEIFSKEGHEQALSLILKI